MSKIKHFLKCKYCDYQIPAWITTKKGKKSHNYIKLETHVHVEHFDEYFKQLEQLAKIDYIPRHI